jgi:holo-[acyl-carrier protein] synthase
MPDGDTVDTGDIGADVVEGVEAGPDPRVPTGPLPLVGPVLGVGIDLCDVERLRAAMTRTPGMRTRIFSMAEQEYCERRRDPAERYAARFAAKEAVLKAMGCGLGSCAVRDIQVLNEKSGEPKVVLVDTAARLAAEKGVVGWHISLTHTSSLAQATALALGPIPAG